MLASLVATLAATLQRSLSLIQKQDIQTAARALQADQTPDAIWLGDDCAVIPDGAGYLLLAAEGMLPQFVESDPWFAGWSAIMVNVSDVYAMGGRPIAVVDTIWSQTRESSQDLWQGMTAAAQAYNVPIVGGHTNCRSPYQALSVAILGRATRLITSFDAQAGDVLLLIVDLRGQFQSGYLFWNAATEADPIQLRDNLNLLPHVAEMAWCRAGKDISNGGIIGTLLMLLEASGCGAVLNLDQIPCPDAVALEDWLMTFPSFGFLLSVAPSHVPSVQDCFQKQGLVCQPIGEFQSTPQLVLRYREPDENASESIVFWDFSQQPLTGFSRKSVN